MRQRTTWILLAVAILAAAYYFFVEEPRHKRSVERANNDNPLTAAFPDAVDRVEISRQDIDIDFDRHDGHWRMLAPVADEADDSSVNTLLYTIARAKLESQIEATPEEFSDFGLSPPAAVVTVEGKLEGDPLRVRVSVGDFSLTKSHCYIRVEGSDGVFLAPAGIRRYAMRSLFEFRNKRIVEVPVEELRRIVIASNGQSIDWRKNQIEDWITIQHGDSIKGDSSSVEGVVRTLRGLRARNIIEQYRAKSDELFLGGEGSVSMWTDVGAPPTVVEFGKKKSDRCYVSNSLDGRVALVDTTALRVFRRTVDDFRDKRLLDFDPGRTTLISLETDNRSTTLINKDTGWAFANPTFGSIDQARAGRLVNALRSLAFAEVVKEHLDDEETYGFDRPAFEITLFDRNDQAIDKMTVGNHVAGDQHVYVTSLSTGILARIDRTLIDRLAEDFNNLGDR